MQNDESKQLLSLIERIENLEKTIKFLSNYKKKTSYITKRIGTQQAAAMKDFIRNMKDIYQPHFTKEDEEKKREIWNYEKNYSAFSNAKCNSHKGDHIYGIREGIKNYDISGSDTLWNLIPCTGDENSGTMCWKKIPNSKKNLVYDTFTDNEIQNFDENIKIKYYKLQNWKNYCEKRGAKLFYTDVKTIDNDYREHFEKQAHETNKLQIAYFKNASIAGISCLSVSKSSSTFINS